MATTAGGGALVTAAGLALAGGAMGSAGRGAAVGVGATLVAGATEGATEGAAGGVVGAAGFKYVGFIWVVPLATVLLVLSLPPLAADFDRLGLAWRRRSSRGQ